MSKLFLLNRYLFKVPACYKLKDARFFGAWGKVPHHADEVNLLWPLATDLSGKCVLVAKFGGYLGATYLPLPEFDWFDDRFGRRDEK